MANVNLAQPDVTLLLDLEGIIREATFSGAIPGESADSWLGRSWVDTVGDDIGGEKVRRMVDDARATGISAFRQMTQRFPSGLELPMEYTTVLLGGRAGLLAVGKNLQAVAELQARLIAAQQAMEKDYWKLREVETRYRLLFDSSNEAILLIRASNLRIVDANAAAIEALGLVPHPRDGVVGRELLPELRPQERETLQTMLMRVREQGKAPGIILHLGSGQAWSVRASQIASELGPAFMLQLAPVGVVRPAASSAQSISIEKLVEGAADGFVAIDQDGIVRHCNQAFLDLVEANSKATVVGERLAKWLWRPGADLTVLLSHVHRNRFVRLFSTAVHGDLGTDTEVEISAAAIGDTDPRYVAILLRDVSRRLSASGSDGLRSSLNSMTEQVGKTPLRKLVRDTVSVVERHYVKAALDLADGNRTAAAEILGLSRQSLYAKLDRYTLGASEAVEESE